jgi:hypothetical protein
MFENGVSNDFEVSHCRYMQMIFKHFPKEYHDSIAEYPLWMQQHKSYFSQAVKTMSNEGRGSDEEIFRYICSYPVIEWYLDQIGATQ